MPAIAWYFAALVVLQICTFVLLGWWLVQDLGSEEQQYRRGQTDNWFWEDEDA